MPYTLAVSQLDPEVALYSDQIDHESRPGLQDQLYSSFVAYTDADPGVPYLWVRENTIATHDMSTHGIILPRHRAVRQRASASV
eukprot:6574871-Prymnesium_polylepis.3